MEDQRSKRSVSGMNGTPVSRRNFVHGVAAGGVLAGLASWGALRPGVARAERRIELAGNEFDLTISAHAVNFTGREGMATLVNGSLPAPTLRWREGDTVTLRVHNELAEATSIHWHGILLPANMDGVPGLSFHGINPGESYTYRFPVRQSGTYWYHAHSAFQEQTGLYGPLIIEPKEPAPFTYDREHVVLLSDWTDRDPDSLYLLLKRRSDYFNFNKRTLGDFVRDSKSAGFRATLADRRMWGQMRMQPSDLADVSAHAYTYLTNGVTPAANWTGLFRPGERVRLRFINGSAMTTFDVRIPGLKMTVVAADGQYVNPVTVDEFRIAVAEVFDVIIEPAGADAFTIFAQSMDRTGYARGTLAVQEGLSAAVPEVDKVVYLSMADMGHNMAGMANMPNMPAMPGMVMPGDPPVHPPSERRNPGVDMQAMMPTPRLDDAGVGLRDNGRRVLTYADLTSSFSDPDGREPERTIELHLTGHMERFMWSFDGVPFSAAEPLRLTYGERVRIVLVNDTMMEHPIHLHGMWSDLEDENGAFHVRKHTVSMPPGTKRAFRVTANALGRWAFHCHLLYHMEAGMFREVRVEESGAHS